VNRYLCYYAETDDGVVWAGPYIRFVPDEPYDWCEGTANTRSRPIGFRLLDIGDAYNYILTLHE
jgi:hypothetical protein